SQIQAIKISAKRANVTAMGTRCAAPAPPNMAANTSAATPNAATKPMNLRQAQSRRGLQARLARGSRSSEAISTDSAPMYVRIATTWITQEYITLTQPNDP